MCSQGRLRKNDPPPTAPLAKKVLEKARELLREAVPGIDKESKGALNFVLRLAAGRFEECPFDKKALDKMVAFLGNELGLGAKDFEVPGGQTFLLGVIGPLLKSLGDPDWGFFEQLKGGVPVGVGVEMPRTRRFSIRKPNGPWTKMWTTSRMRS